MAGGWISRALSLIGGAFGRVGVSKVNPRGGRCGGGGEARFDGGVLDVIEGESGAVGRLRDLGLDGGGGR